MNTLIVPNDEVNMWLSDGPRNKTKIRTAYFNFCGWLRNQNQNQFWN